MLKIGLEHWLKRAIIALPNSRICLAHAYIPTSSPLARLIPIALQK